MNTQLAGRRVVVAEDEPLFRQVAVEVIRSLHPSLQVYPAVNGHEALGLLRSLQADLLITDIQMPVLDGFGLLQTIINEAIAVPALVMSAFGSFDIERRLQQLGALYFLEKPIDLASLRSLVVDFLPAPQAPIRGVSLPGFVQLLAVERKSCQLLVRSGSRHGFLLFRDGRLVHAETEQERGEAAALDLLSWSLVKLEMRLQSPSAATTITQDLSFLLFESVRQSDERASCPDLAPADRAPPCSTRSLRSTRPPGAPERLQDVVKDLLARRHSLDGLLGLAVVDRESGLPLMSEGSPGLAMDAIGTYLCQMVRVQACSQSSLGGSRPVEELSLSFHDQLHVLRPLEGLPQLLVCAVLDRARTNLGRALLQLRELTTDGPPSDG